MTTLHKPRLQPANPARSVCVCATGIGGPGSSSGRGRGRKQRAQLPGMFEVQIVSPPPKSLGIHPLPPNTHNGDQISVDGQDYVVSSVVLQYKLVKGKYQRDHNRLEVQHTGRYFTNLYLEQLLHKSHKPRQGDAR